MAEASWQKMGYQPKGMKRYSRDQDYLRLMRSKQWRVLRNQLLASFPLCVRCKNEGRITSATEIHHIVPVENGRNYQEKQQLAFSVANLIPLCRECHRQEHILLGKNTRQQQEAKAKTRAEEYCRRFFGIEPRG